jgi:hypothetical protein
MQVTEKLVTVMEFVLQHHTAVLNREHGVHCDSISIGVLRAWGCSWI